MKLENKLLRGEINVVLAHDAQSATDSAIDLVKTLNAEKRHVYAVNTVYNIRLLNAMLRKKLGKGFKPDERDNPLYCYASMPHGTLGQSEELLKQVGWDEYDTVIITTWELAARSYRMREALLFDLQELTHNGVTVIIYSTATTEPAVGKADRGGIGRLAIVAANIVSIAKEYRSKVALTNEEIREATIESWPEAYEQWKKAQERKKSGVGSRESDGQAVRGSGVQTDVAVILNEVKNPLVEAAEGESITTRHERDSSPQDLRPLQNDGEVIHPSIPPHAHTSTPPRRAQLSRSEINELGTLQTKKQRRGEALPRPMEKELEYATIN